MKCNKKLTVVHVVEQILQQYLAPFLAVLVAVQGPLLQQGLPTAVHVRGQQAGEPLLQQGVHVVRHLAQQHVTWSNGARRFTSARG